jgi:hypothetical protein
MPITMLDFILLGVMLISGLLAMIRGFFREILSIAGWVAAAGVTLYAFAKLKPVTQQYINNDTVASAVTAAGVFLLTLIIVSVFTVRISDKILDSRVGALDGTRPDHRGGGLHLFRLAGPETTADLDRKCQVTGRPAGDRIVAHVPFAGGCR